MRFTPDNIETLAPNEVFVFGSNQAGRHGGGAALLAKRKFGAIEGATGHVGKSFGISTKDFSIRTLPLEAIEENIGRFIVHAAAHPELTFLVTQIGCGLAGYKPSDIAPLFFKFAIPKNVVLPEAFHAEVGE